MSLISTRPLKMILALSLILTLARCPGGGSSDSSAALLGLLGGGGGGRGNASPRFSLPAGVYSSNQSLTLTSSTQSASIYYTTDGSIPTDANTLYTAPIEINRPVTIKAIAISGGESSTVSSAEYSMSLKTRVYTFNQAMDVGTQPTILAENFDGSSWNTIPTSGTTFVWNNSTTLTVNISWKQFPENADMRLTLSNLLNASNEAVADIIDTFSTGVEQKWYALADSGLTECYNDSAVQPCGDNAWPRQDGDYLNTPSGPDFVGPTLSFANNYTTKDNITGLTWKSCSEGASGADCTTGSATALNWYDAVNSCASLNTENAGLGYANRTNWRLPTERELLTLIDYSIYNPGVVWSINAAAFPNIQPTHSFCSLTAREGSFQKNSIIYVGNAGNVTAGAKSAIGCRVRCVSQED